MKKFAWIILILAALSLGAQDDEQYYEEYYKFQVNLSANFLMSGDKAFVATYKGALLFPELFFSYKFKPNFFAFAGYGFLSAKGQTADLGLATKTSQQYISLGAGYNRPLGEKFELFGSLGAVMVLYKEDAFDDTIKGSSFGFRVDASGAYKFSERLLAGLNLGYIFASKKVEVEEGMDPETASMGGFKVGLGVSYRF